MNIILKIFKKIMENYLDRNYVIEYKVPKR